MCVVTNDCKKWFTFLGSFLILFPMGIQWYWGNLSVYVSSYVNKYVDSSLDAYAPWVMSLTVVGSCLGLVSSAFMSRLLGKRVAMVIGIGLFNAGLIGAYFGVQKSPMALNFSYGIVMSTGAYILDGVAMQYMMSWSGEKFGFFVALLQSSFTGGAIIVNQVITRYINPRNLSPDIQIGPSIFFSQEKVVDKVPSVFFILLSIVLPASTLGIVMVRENTETHAHGALRKTNAFDTDVMTYGGIISEEHKSGSSHEQVEERDVRSKQTTDGDSICNELSPSQVIRCWSLYLYCGFAILGEITFIIMTSYYKTYGLVYILDDHFITDVSFVLLLVITLSRTGWGMLLDRFGLKNTYVIYFSSCALTALFFNFSPLVNKWCYMIMALVFGCAGNPTYVLLAYACNKTYGESHFLLNYALVMSSTIFTNLALPPLFQLLLVDFGWFYLFAACSGFNLIGLILAIVILSNKWVS